LRGTPPRALGGLTPRRVPEAYVRAEVASFPLANIKSFREVVTELSPSLGNDDAGRRTAELWGECERLMCEHASGWSLDRLLAIRDSFWFECLPHGRPTLKQRYGTEPLHCYLRRLAGRYLERHAGITEVVEWRANVVEAMTHYRWLTFALPEDLLLAATGIKPAPTRVSVDPPLIVRRLLDRGVAEIHQHVNGGMDFPTLWVSALAALADPKLDPNALSSPGLPFGDSEMTFRWLLAAAVARSVLAEFLLTGEDDFLQYVRTAETFWVGQRWRLIERALTALSSGTDDALPGFCALRSLYQEIHREGYLIATDGPPESVGEVWSRCDPIGVRLRLDERNTGEGWFVENGLSRLERWENEGKARQVGCASFERVFWQVLRVRCLLYRIVVQRPMTAGLQWFIRFFARLQPLRKPLKRARAELAYRNAGGEKNQWIAALEVRASLEETSFMLAEELRQLTASWSKVLDRVPRTTGGFEPEFGVILHLQKERDPKQQWARGKPSARGIGVHAEPHPFGAVRLGGRYSTYFASQSMKALAAGDLFEAVPEALWVLRGLDVTADELSVPTWVLVPLYRNLEQRSARAAAQCHPPELEPPPLRLTAHVGEDFRHLMEGLRRIFECLQYLLREPGGRLGHATALGVEPRLWAEETGSVMMPAEERLWDLVFEWRLYSHFRVPDELRAKGTPGRIASVESQIRQLSLEIFQEPEDGRSLGTPSILAMAHDELHRLWVPPSGREQRLGLDAFNGRVAELSFKAEGPPRAALDILRRYLTDEEVYRRGQVLHDVPLDEAEINALCSVQDALRRCIGARSVVVEINPSSNLLIGNLLDLRNHPTLRLYPPEPEEGSPPPVPIALGSDDPVTFSTNCLREYSLLFSAALSAGYSERSVVKWLEDIQRTSMDARFTLAWRPSARSMAKRLVERFDRYLQTSSAARELRRRREQRDWPRLPEPRPVEPWASRLLEALEAEHQH
jgi:hypothetical protein